MMNTTHKTKAPETLSTALQPKAGVDCMDECKKDFLITEYIQTCEAHRHLENLRTRYLAFLFTVSFAGTALIGSIIGKIQSNSMAALSLSLIVSILSACMIWVIGNLINSMKDIFPHFESVWKGIRIHFCSDQVEQLLNVRNNFYVKNRSQKFGDSLKNISCFLLGVFLFISVVIIYNLVEPFFFEKTRCLLSGVFVFVSAGILYKILNKFFHFSTKKLNSQYK